MRELLDKEKDIDAVTISTLDHIHASVAPYAMERDKHVYVQKPLAHNVRETRLMRNGSREKIGYTDGKSRCFQSSPRSDSRLGRLWCNRNYKRSKSLDQSPSMATRSSNAKGQCEYEAKVRMGFMVGPAKESPYTPEMHPFNWRGWWQYGTGALGDMEAI